MNNREDRFHTTSWDVRQMNRTTEPAQQQSDTKTERKKKKKKKKINPILAILLWVAFVVGSSYALAGMGWKLANDLCALNKPYQEASVEIPETWINVTKEIEKEDGTTEEKIVCDMKKVTAKLKDEGLVEYDWFFRLFAWFYKADEKIKQGTYTLNSDMDYVALIRGMRGASGGSAVTVDISIPEGYSVKQIIDLLAEKGVASKEALTDAAANYVFEDYAFVDNENLGEISRLEGYLYPDTYNFYVGGKAATALNSMLSNFNKRVYANEELAPLFEAASERGYELEDIIKIASLIEKETDGGDRTKIASVIYNRLENSAETAYFLQIDAALVYAAGRSITQADYTDLKSPYNLYLHTGLPPTPIANPGQASIRAALEPADTEYYFYVLGEDGTHIFSETLAQHQTILSGQQ